MPFVVAGVAWLGRVIWMALPWLVEFFAKWVTRRLAVAAAMVAAFLALTSAFYAMVYGVVSAVSVVAPPYFAQACSLFLPDNTYLCLSVIVTTYVIRWLYDVQLHVLTYTNPGAGF